jgi:hypothetical protein
MKTFLTLVGVLILSSWQCVASVAIDAVGPSASGTSASGASSLTWSHTVTSSGSNLALVVGVGVGVNADTGMTLSVTYNSMPMASVGLVHADNQSAGFVQMFCLAAPTSGAHTVAITLSGGTAVLIGGSISFTGVNQSSPCKNAVTASSNSTSVSVSVTSAPGDMVVDVAGTGTSISSSTKSIAWLQNVNSGTGDSNAAQSTAAGASSVTMGYTGPNDYWGIVGVDIAASSVAISSFSPCDINQDGVVNSADVTAAVNLVLTPPGTCTAVIVGAGACNVAVVQRVIAATLTGGTCHPVSLSWTASSSPNIAGYNIYRSTNSGTGYVKLNSALITGTSYPDATSQPGQVYYYVATSVDISGNESAFSNPPAMMTIPSP